MLAMKGECGGEITVSDISVSDYLSISIIYDSAAGRKSCETAEWIFPENSGVRRICGGIVLKRS